MQKKFCAEGPRYAPAVAGCRRGQLGAKGIDPQGRNRQEASRILAEGLIAAPQLAQRPQAMFPVIDRAQHSRTQ